MNTLVLYVIFRRRHGPLDEPFLVRRFFTHLLLAAALGACLFVLGRPLATAPGSLLTPTHVLQFVGILTSGGGLYLGLGLLFRVEEVVALGRKVMRLLTWKP
jgi:hypothetical protein